MARDNFLFTSESVSEGHPDKICDRISDAVLDTLLEEEPTARVACETFATTDRVIVGGEIGLNDQRKLASFLEKLDSIVRTCVRDIGYEQEGFHWKNIKIDNYLHKQSAHIAQGVDKNGAGDQGIMFGYAINETSELMPAPIHYAHLILKKMSEARKEGRVSNLGPDSKSQLTIQYENGVPTRATSIVISSQHLDESLSSDDVKSIVEPFVAEVLPGAWIDNKTQWHVNPTGKFVVGGPDGDTGLTGRKIVVDTYGGAAPHGGGAFSGKDPTKVDRSAAYAARYLAKNVVASGLATRCLIQLSYAIGVSEPLSIYVDTFNTGAIADSEIEARISKVMDLTPNGIINHLKLLKPIYQKTSAYGHFGRVPEKDGSFSWEKTDLVDMIKV